MSTMQEEQISGPVLAPDRTRRSFPKEFKTDAVALVLDERRSCAWSVICSNERRPFE